MGERGRGGDWGTGGLGENLLYAPTTLPPYYPTTLPPYHPTTPDP